MLWTHWKEETNKITNFFFEKIYFFNYKIHIVCLDLAKRKYYFYRKNKFINKKISNKSTTIAVKVYEKINEQIDKHLAPIESNAWKAEYLFSIRTHYKVSRTCTLLLYPPQNKTPKPSQTIFDELNKRPSQTISEQNITQTWLHYKDLIQSILHSTSFNWTKQINCKQKHWSLLTLCNVSCKHNKICVWKRYCWLVSQFMTCDLKKLQYQFLSLIPHAHQMFEILNSKYSCSNHTRPILKDISITCAPCFVCLLLQKLFIWS